MDDQPITLDPTADLIPNPDAGLAAASAVDTAVTSSTGVRGLLAGASVELQNLVLDSHDVEYFLNNLARIASSNLSTPGHEVFCGVTLLRPRHAETVASSSEAALQLDEIQYSYGDGPCLTAARSLKLVYVPDTRTDTRWPEYFAAIAEHGMLSILGVPVPLEGEADCALNLYSSTANGFTPEAAEAASDFAREASRSLRLAVRIAHLSDKEAHLSAALESRTTIDLAVGIIMGQNKCSQSTAMNILKAASNSRNQKVRTVAERIIATTSDETPTTHFD
jgi:GAF domain-containing protein